jgi:hypothetical protein
MTERNKFLEMQNQKLIKCARCKREVSVPESWMQKCCPSCLDKLKETYRKERGFVPTKEMIEERSKIEKEHLRELCEKFGTTRPDCLRFRELEESGNRNEFWFEHLETCHDCGKWIKQKPLDLNNIGNKNQDGYTELFRNSEFQEPLNHGWVSMCPFCGAPLDEKGECTNKRCPQNFEG